MAAEKAAPKAAAKAAPRGASTSMRAKAVASSRARAMLTELGERTEELSRRAGLLLERLG